MPIAGRLAIDRRARTPSPTVGAILTASPNGLEEIETTRSWKTIKMPHVVGLDEILCREQSCRSHGSERMREMTMITDARLTEPPIGVATAAETATGTDLAKSRRTPNGWTLSNPRNLSKRTLRKISNVGKRE